MRACCAAANSSGATAIFSADWEQKENFHRGPARPPPSPVHPQSNDQKSKDAKTIQMLKNAVSRKDEENKKNAEENKEAIKEAIKKKDEEIHRLRQALAQKGAVESESAAPEFQPEKKLGQPELEEPKPAPLVAEEEEPSPEPEVQP